MHNRLLFPPFSGFNNSGNERCHSWLLPGRKREKGFQCRVFSLLEVDNNLETPCTGESFDTDSWFLQLFTFKLWRTLSAVGWSGPAGKHHTHSHSYNLWHGPGCDTPDGTWAGWSEVHPTFLRKAHTFSPPKRSIFKHSEGRQEEKAKGRKSRSALWKKSQRYEKNLSVKCFKICTD